MPGRSFGCPSCSHACSMLLYVHGKEGMRENSATTWIGKERRLTTNQRHLHARRRSLKECHGDAVGTPVGPVILRNFVRWWLESLVEVRRNIPFNSELFRKLL